MKDSILGKLQAMANKAGNNKKAILERINDIEKRLKVNNDLLETSPEKNRRLLEACKTAKAVVKYGMTSKALKLVANNNLKLREDLCIDIQEYMILPLFIISPNEIYDVEKLCYLVGGQNNYIDILKILFRMYEKHILRVSIDQDISFNISLALRTYLQETKEFKVVARTLKDVIRDVDAIANLYNNTETFAQIAQRQITKILEEYRGEFDFCQMMLDLRHSCEEYPFVWYCLCHCILNGCSIDRESDLINMWVHHDASRAEIVNYVFNNDNAYIFKNKIFERSIDESGKADKNCIEVASDFKRKYLKGIVKEKRFDDIIKCSDIHDKKAFFNEPVQKQVDELASLLSVENFNGVVARLKEEGLRTGFACLFSGIPGSGKCLEGSEKITIQVEEDIAQALEFFVQSHS